jgi:hypothetical protein
MLQREVLFAMLSDERSMWVTPGEDTDEDGTKDTSQVTPGRTAPRPPGFSSPSSITSTCRSEATTLAVAARRTGRRYAWVLPDASGNALHPPAIVVVGNADEVMARLEHVDLFVVNARRGCRAASGTARA